MMRKATQPLQSWRQCTINESQCAIRHYLWCIIVKASRANAGLPPPVVRMLRRMGADISVARRRRKLSVQSMAERAFIGRNTITRLERGDPGVSIGIYATVLFILGLADQLGEV